MVTGITSPASPPHFAGAQWDLVTVDLRALLERTNAAAEALISRGV